MNGDPLVGKPSHFFNVRVSWVFAPLEQQQVPELLSPHLLPPTASWAGPPHSQVEMDTQLPLCLLALSPSVTLWLLDLDSCP